LGLLRWDDSRRRKLCLIIPVTADPGAPRLLQVCQLRPSPRHATLRTCSAAISPCPISTSSSRSASQFYTFHTISYIVDSYRGVIKPTRNFFEFAAYVSLFSQLVGGPIVRFRQIEQDLENLGTADRTRWLLRGISFFIVGLMEKVVMADQPGGLRRSGPGQTIRRCPRGGRGLPFWDTRSSCTSTYQATHDGRCPRLHVRPRIPQNFNSPYKALDPA
jgi:hypothetical protein